MHERMINPNQLFVDTGDFNMGWNPSDGDLFWEFSYVCEY
jgi:hypothetical protein